MNLQEQFKSKISNLQIQKYATLNGQRSIRRFKKLVLTLKKVYQIYKMFCYSVKVAFNMKYSRLKLAKMQEMALFVDL